MTNNLESSSDKETINTTKQTINSDSWIIENNKGTIDPSLMSFAEGLQTPSYSSSTADVSKQSGVPHSSVVPMRKLERMNFEYIEPTIEHTWE